VYTKWLKRNSCRFKHWRLHEHFENGTQSVSKKRKFNSFKNENGTETFVV